MPPAPCRHTLPHLRHLRRHLLPDLRLQQHAALLRRLQLADELLHLRLQRAHRLVLLAQRRGGRGAVTLLAPLRLQLVLGHAAGAERGGAGAAGRRRLVAWRARLRGLLLLRAGLLLIICFRLCLGRLLLVLLPRLLLLLLRPSRLFCLLGRPAGKVGAGGTPWPHWQQQRAGSTARRSAGPHSLRH